MARTVKDSKLDNRTARLRLPARHEPHWRTIDAGMHIGYRRGSRKASWLARYYKPTGGYLKKTLGIPDDTQDADGIEILSFGQAQEEARQWFREIAAERSGRNKPPLTVREVMQAYLDWFKANRKGLQAVRYNIRAHILPELGDIEIEKLTAARIRRFHQDIAEAPARLRTRKGAEQRYRPEPVTEDQKRARRVTANKILSTLKAALNHAFEDNDVATDEAWRRTRPYRNVEAPRVRYMTLDECRRLANAAEPNFRRLIQAALLTGCRYGELGKMRARDFSRDAGSVHIPQSKSSKPRDIPLTDAGLSFFSNVTAGLSGDALVFRRDDGGAWGKSHQRRPMLIACAIAKIEPPTSFHITRHTYGSHLAMAGTPMAVISHALGHADTRITERHYGHLSPSYVSDTIRANLPNIVEVDQTSMLDLAGGGCDHSEKHG